MNLSPKKLAFSEHFLTVMPELTGKTPKQISATLRLILNPSQIFGYKDVMDVLIARLQVYIAAAYPDKDTPTVETAQHHLKTLKHRRAKL